MNEPERTDRSDDTRTSRGGDRWILAALLLLALALRIGFALTRPIEPRVLASALPDQGEYLQLAQSLLHGEGLRLWDDRFEQYVYAYRTPGYPLFVAMLGAKVRWVLLAQSILDASCVLAVAWMARFVLSSRAAILAGVLVALNPYLIYFSGTVLSETLFTALLAWGMAFLLITDRHVLARLMTGSILLALAVLVRPSAIWLPPLLGLCAAIANRRHLVASVVLPLLITVLLLFPWAYRNHQVIGRWVWTTTNGGITLYDGFHPTADGSSDQSFLKTEPGLLGQLNDLSETDRNSFLSKRAVDYVRAHPERLLPLTIAKIARTWSPVPLSAQFGSSRLNVIAGYCYGIPLFGLTLLGLAKGRASKTIKIFLLLPAIYFTLIHAVSVGSLRYRVPADVPMAVIASLVVSRRLSVVREEGSRQ